MEQGAMTAKAYLMQVRKARAKIEQMKEQLEELRAASGIPVQPDGERVLSSPAQGGCADIAVRVVQLEHDLEHKLIEFYELRIRMLELIHSISGSWQYIDILYRRYIKGESFEEISVAIGYTFRHITRLHGEALKAFQEVLDKMS